MAIGILALVSIFLAIAYFILLRSPISVLVAPLAIAAIVVYLLNPVVSFLERRGMRRIFGVTLVYVVFLVIVSTILRLLIPMISEQLTAFIDALPGYANTAIERANQLLARLGYDVRISLDNDEIARLIQENRQTIIGLIGGVRDIAGQILHVLVVLAVGIILSIYLLLDLPKIQRGFMQMIPERVRPELTDILERISATLGGFFRGQLLVATFVGVASAVGLTIAGVPFGILIGLIAGILNLVPLIGPFLAMIPAVLVGLLSGQPSKALWAAIVLLVVQQIDNHVVSPNVMGRTVNLHPVTVMLALLAGAALAGILGMLVVIPSVAVAKVLIAALWARRGMIGLPDDRVPGSA